MKVKVVIEFEYGEKMSKLIEEIAKKENVPIEEIARVSVRNMFYECYDCMEDETYSVSAELVED